MRRTRLFKPLITRRSLAQGFAPVALLAIAACSASSNPPAGTKDPRSSMTADATWVAHETKEPSAESPDAPEGPRFSASTMVGFNDSFAVFTEPSGSGAARDEASAWVSHDAETWSRRPIDQPDEIQWMSVRGAASSGKRVVIGGQVGQGSPASNAAAWYSGDGGETWRLTLNEPAGDGGIHAIVSTDEGFVAVGSPMPNRDTRRNGIGEAPIISWHSADGEHWFADTFEPTAPDRSKLAERDTTAVAASAETMIAIDHEHVFQRANIDGPWKEVIPYHSDEVIRFNDVAVSGDDIVLFGVTDPTISGDLRNRNVELASHDGGTTWHEVPLTAAAFGDGTAEPAFTPMGVRTVTKAMLGIHDVATWRDRFYATAIVSDRSNPSYCYRDASTCQQQALAVLVSEDGTDWRRTLVGEPVPQLAGAPYKGPSRFVHRSVPTIVSSHGDRVWRLQGDGAPPSIHVDQFRPPREDEAGTPPFLSFDERLDSSEVTLKIGDVWRYEYFIEGGPTTFDANLIHPFSNSNRCGSVALNDKFWTVAEAKVAEPYPIEWPLRTITSDGLTVRSVFTNIVLVDANRIEISIEGADVAWVLTPTTSPDTPTFPEGRDLRC